MMTNLFLFTKDSEPQKSKGGFGNFASILDRRSTEVVKKKNISKPYQFFGVWIAQNLGEYDNIGLYIKLAKYQDHNLLTQAVSYIKDYPDPKSRHRLFMWYLKGKLKKVKSEKPKTKKKVKAKSLF